MKRKTILTLLAVLVFSGLGGAAGKDDDKEKPGLYLRASPRFAFSPASILFTAELRGGDDVEELYCPEIQWEWGDGGKSIQESDCDPWTPETTIERRFTNRHQYPRSGEYRIRVTLSRSGKTIASQSVQVTVRAGAGESMLDY